MKRIVSFFIIAIIVLSLYGCGYSKTVSSELPTSSVSLRDFINVHKDSAPTTFSVSVRDSISAHKAGGPAADEPDGPLTLEEYVANVDEYVNRRYVSQGYDYYIESEEDYDGAGSVWVEVYLWRDDTLPTAEDAYNDDPAALADWIALTNDVAEADGELYQAMLDAGLNDTILLNLVDQEDYEYLLAFTDSGEIVYDQVTGIDRWGWDEE